MMMTCSRFFPSSTSSFIYLSYAHSNQMSVWRHCSYCGFPIKLKIIITFCINMYVEWKYIYFWHARNATRQEPHVNKTSFGSQIFFPSKLPSKSFFFSSQKSTISAFAYVVFCTDNWRRKFLLINFKFFLLLFLSFFFFFVGVIFSGFLNVHKNSINTFKMLVWVNTKKLVSKW